MRVILIGKASGRLDCLAETITRNKTHQLFILTNCCNPGLNEKGFLTLGPTDNPEFVSTYAGIVRNSSDTIAIISNEESLAAGVADTLRAIGIPTVGPNRCAAQIETSKNYARRLLRHDPDLSRANPDIWATFGPSARECLKKYTTSLDALGCPFVIKPDGLTAGKGVRVQGVHFNGIDEALAYCDQIFANGESLIIEQRMEGEEFSRMCFTDGKTVIPMPAVQDHKRLREGDEGINTGGMGSYSDANHSLPFLSAAELARADAINASVIQRMHDSRNPFVGFLYGGFIATAKGVKLIEYNARLGDPEALNVLPLLETDFVDLCYAIATGQLGNQDVQFSARATVCKYLIPKAYPECLVDDAIDLSGVKKSDGLRVYYGALDGTKMTGSRALATVGIGRSLGEAEKIAERAAQQVHGAVYHRSDIGTAALVERRVQHMNLLREIANLSVAATVH